MPALIELKILLALMPLVMKKEQHNLETNKMMIFQAQECIRSRIPMTVKHTLLVENNKRNIIRIQAQEPMMLTMKELRTQQEHMPLVMKRELLSLVTAIKMMTFQAQECTKKLILMMVKHLP